MIARCRYPQIALAHEFQLPYSKAHFGELFLLLNQTQSLLAQVCHNALFLLIFSLS
ncbi:hypothetical protein [Vibrio vulnificus YJ016]|uniref:Uncharacterized protein n=1 Tax=Vibrio vulnificus (strain YJ016) TaxID=196600 RepID=Q7MIW6_VIBVY|nr:hypothetical protein [Vibrio vulnificus YJ016]